MAITRKVELFWGFELLKKKYFLSYHINVNAVLTHNVHEHGMTALTGLAECVCDQPGRAFVLGLRGHLAPLPVLVISLFPLSRAALSLLYLSLPLFSQLQSLHPPISRSPSPLPKAMPSCRLWSGGQGGERKWVRKLCWRLQENKAGISSRWGWERERWGNLVRKW